VLLRADASRALGLGHVARIAALADACAEAGIDPIAVIGGDPAALGAVAAAPALAAARAAGEALAAGARDGAAGLPPPRLAAAAAAAGVSVVVIDGPALAPLCDAIADRGGAPMCSVIVDDTGACPPTAAAVVNHNAHAHTLAARYPASAVQLLGRHYLLLRRAIAAAGHGACRAPAPGAALRHALVFGGSDPTGGTARVLAAMPRGRPLELVALLGPGFGGAGAGSAIAAAAAIAAARGHRVELHHGPPDPGALLASCHAAVSAAGGTLGELAYLGCPALAFAVAADQRAPADHLRAAGLIAGGQDLAAQTATALADALGAFLADDAGRAAQRERALATVDGGGARRTLAAIAAL
jgi:spore coat polysaccharide biosynthesis predicted glycosyltransferase SpsG